MLSNGAFKATREAFPCLHYRESNSENGYEPEEENLRDDTVISDFMSDSSGTCSSSSSRASCSKQSF